MKDLKNIDRLFQEKFKDFEVNPPESVWYHVENTLQKSTVVKPKTSWMWFVSGIAVGMAALYLLNTPFNIITPINRNAKDVVQENSATEDIAVVSPENKTTSVNLPTLKPKKSSILFPFNTNEFQAKENLLNPVTEPQIPLAVNDVNAQQIERKLHIGTQELPVEPMAENQAVTKNNVHSKKWSVSTVAAPVMLNAFNNEVSALDEKLNENIKNTKISSSIGVQIAYQMSEKFAIQTGVHMVDYTYLTQDIDYSSGNELVKYDNIAYSKSSEIDHTVDNSKTANYIKAPIQANKGDLSQVIGYVEIPVEAKYKLVGNNSFGFQVIGGFSTLLLNKNELYVKTVENYDKIGEATNLNSLNFSGNLGLEMDYKLLKNLNFNVNPMFKVQTRTLNTDNGFKPYTFGVYSGLNFRF